LKKNNDYMKKINT